MTTIILGRPTRVTVMDIKAHGLPDGTFRSRKFYIELTVEKDVKKTTISERGNTASWDEVISFDTHVPSTLELHVYAHHRIRDETYIGGIKECIDVKEPTKGFSLFHIALSSMS